jgi:hypothetical protein
MRIRPALAIACCLIGAGSMLLEAHGQRYGDSQLFIGLTVVILVAGALLVLRPLWAGLAGRGLLWTTLAMTTLISSIERPVWMSTVTALAVCAALVILGRHALDRSTAAFQPSHHRGPLTLALVLGFADVATLCVFAVMALIEGGVHELGLAAVFAAIAVAIAVSLVGLYRLYAWGFLLNLGLNVTAVVLMLFDVFHLDVARLIFIVPALAQVVIALPVLVAIVRRRPLVTPRPIARLGAFVPVTAVAIMAGLNVQVWFGAPALRVLVRWGMSHL